MIHALKVLRQLVEGLSKRFVMSLAQKLTICGLALSLAGCMGSAASLDVPAGKTSVITSDYTYNTSTCVYGAVPKSRIIKAPRNGSARVSVQRLPKSAVSNPRCAVSNPVASVVTYTPRAGFRGKDMVVIEITSKVGPNAGIESPITYEVTINVK
jgi:hypothetical protein